MKKARPKTKEGFTTQDIEDFWEEHRPCIGPFVTIGPNGPVGLNVSSLNGMYFSKANTIIVLKDGLFHNPCGPAHAYVGLKLGRVIHKTYFLDGTKIPPDDIVFKMIQRREKSHYEQRLWL